MDFSEALAVVKTGGRITRTGWNGRDQYVCYQPGYPGGIGINANTAKATGLPEGALCRFLPYLMFRTAQGDFVPWLASQADLLADDWQTVTDAVADSVPLKLTQQEAKWLPVLATISIRRDDDSGITVPPHQTSAWVKLGSALEKKEND